MTISEKLFKLKSNVETNFTFLMYFPFLSILQSIWAILYIAFTLLKTKALSKRKHHFVGALLSISL